ncbi:MAG TPA: hypothetical protein VGH28_16320 [Polyangiaceae bacterium]|jgi:hypothetical protein
MPRPDPQPSEELLELPPLDGEGDDEPSDDAPREDEDVAVRDDADPYDDAAGDDADFSEGVDTADEPSALADDDTGFSTEDDEPIEDAPGESMLGDEDAPGVAGEDFGLVDGGDSIRDGGEEGFDAPEPELRVEDLPRLDAGDDDDFSVAEIGEVIAPPELRWDDRGFDRLFARALGHVVRIRVHAGVEVVLEDGTALRSLDGGETFGAADHDGDDDEALVARGRVRALLRDGVGVLRAVDDGPLVLLESTDDATAFTLLEDGSILAARDGAPGARLVRIPLEGGATVVAEEESTIEAVAVDPRSGIVYCGGAFGLSAYRPS